MPKEELFQTKLRKYIEGIGGYIVKFNASGISKTGVPDLLACINGIFVGIEVKKEDGVISDIQQWNINKIRVAGGVAFCIKPNDFKLFKDVVTKNSTIDDIKKMQIICKHNEK